MNIIRISFFILFVTSCNTYKAPQAKNLLKPEGIIKGEKLDLIVKNTEHFPPNTQMAVAIIKDSVVEFWGMKRVGDSLIREENYQKAFEIGSISKVFTASLLADEVEKGNLNLEDKVDEKLGMDFKPEASFTFAQLSNHSSGLPRLAADWNKGPDFDKDNPYSHYDNEKLENYMINEVELRWEPGKFYEYSNLGVGLLGYALEKLNDQSFESLLKERILDKHGMKHTAIAKESLEVELVPARDIKGELGSNWDLGALQGAGGIKSTVEDLSQFVLAHFYKNDTVLTLTRKQTFSENGNTVGLGWHIIEKIPGIDWHFHNGGTGGYRSSLAMDTDKKTAVIILSNLSAFSSNSGNIDNICFGLLKGL